MLIDLRKTSSMFKEATRARIEDFLYEIEKKKQLNEPLSIE